MTRKVDESIKTKWKVNDVIRDSTGHPYLVLHLNKFVATIVTDLESPHVLTPIMALLPRDYKAFELDWNMRPITTPQNDSFSWEQLPATL